jgi:acyl carrier protein
MQKKLNTTISKIFKCKQKEKNNIININDLRQLENFDSLIFVKFIIEIEKKFKIKINENNLSKFYYKNKILNLINKNDRK